MADVKLSHVYKVYDGNVKAVSDFNIDIKDKEFIVFVGPSGCGKSTTLRMIAGLEDITAGDLFIQDQLVNDVQPKDRDIAMVFQNYALYPHMTVYENMAFSLKNRHMPKEEINRRVLEAARILDIEPYLQRKPKAMSGGQRQRVSLGRAIVRQPKVFLLDEPLSNLDAKLRAQMRTEIAKLHKKLATTFIYVTHDQVEAMTMGTRIVVMKLGFVQQIDTPTNLYEHPINKFVAGFIGTPQMNFFDVTIEKVGKDVKLIFKDKQEYVSPLANFFKCDPKYMDGKTHVTLGLRPDALLVTKPTSKDSHIDLIVAEIEELGNETLLYCDLASDIIDTDKVGRSSVIVKVSPDSRYTLGQKISVKIAEGKIHLFDNETEKTIMPFIPEVSYQKIDFTDSKFTLFGKTYPTFSAWKDIPAGKGYDIVIPHYAIVPGKAYSLPVIKVETIDENSYLVILHNEADDSYITVKSETAPEVGSSFSFGLKYADIILPEELNTPAVTKETSIIGRFTKVKEVDDKDYNLVNAKYKSEKEEYKVEKAIAKYYLTREEFGANTEVHNEVLNKVNSMDNKELLAKREALLASINTSLESTEYDEEEYIKNKQDLIAVDKEIAALTNKVFLEALSNYKQRSVEVFKVSEEAMNTAKTKMQLVLDSFEEKSKEVLNNIIEPAPLKEKAMNELKELLVKTYSSHSIWADEFPTNYILSKIDDFSDTETYVNLMERNDPAVFSNNPPSNISKEQVSKLNTKLFNEIVHSYKLAIASGSIYVKGFYLGNNTKWHNDANKNADELFELYKKTHSMLIEDFTLCNKRVTKDFKLRKIHNFYINLGDSKFKIDDELIGRLNNIEGDRLLKHEYRFVITPLVEAVTSPGVKAVQEHVVSDAKKNVEGTTDTVTTKLTPVDVVTENLNTTEIRSLTKAEIENNASINEHPNIAHEILAVNNYDAHTFIKVKIGDIISDIEITGLPKASDYNISLDPEGGVAIYTLDTEIRIA